MLKAVKTVLGLLSLGACCVTLAPSEAAAHGEKALEPFTRMRTIQWYDVQWSQQKLNVNDELVVTGKFHVAEDWPRGVPKPDATYLNVSSPGPVFIRTERYLNGQSSVSSASLKLGGDYDFKIVLKARLRGRYHLHPFFNLHDAGAVMGPGQWLEVAGDPAAFTNQVKALNGDIVDMESYGLANGVMWHLFWIGLGSAWLLWWVRRPLFLPRYKMLQLGQESALITPLDRKIAALMLAGVPLFVFGAQAMTDRQYPRAIPLQAGMDQIEPLPAAVNGLVKMKVQRAEFNPPARSLTMVAQIHNESDQPVQIGELATANVRFLNPGVGPSRKADPDTLIAPQGLSLDSAVPIQPGETRSVRITATDSLWQRERLDGLIRDADSRLGGLLFFYGANGERYIASVSTAIIPTYN